MKSNIKVNMLEAANQFLEKNKRGFRVNGKSIKESKIKDSFEILTKDEKEQERLDRLRRRKQNSMMEVKKRRLIE